jgi:hypothetical protein
MGHIGQCFCQLCVLEAGCLCPVPLAALCMNNATTVATGSKIYIKEGALITHALKCHIVYNAFTVQSTSF